MSSTLKKKGEVKMEEEKEEEHPRWKILFRKCFTRDSHWTKDDILEVIFWERLILALVMGVVAGALPLPGIPGILLFFVSTFIFTHIYVFKYLGVDEDLFGEGSPHQEGLMNSFGLYLLLWVVVYSAFHAPGFI